MEITLKIVLSADPAFLAALTAITGKSLSAELPPSGGDTVKDTASKVKKIKEAAAATPAVEQAPAAPVTPVATNGLTLEGLRARAVPLSKAGHKDVIKAKIAELGYESIANLQEKDFVAFDQFLNTLK